MQLEEILALWKNAAGEPGGEPWCEDEVYGFFQRFRPDGDRLEEALLPLQYGREVLKRMKAIYAATNSGWSDDESSDGYFVVRNPAPIEPAEAESLVRKHLEQVAKIAEEAGAEELVELLRAPTYSIAREAAPDSPDRHDTDLTIYDTLCDWVGALETDPPQVSDLNEAFFSIACDYPLAWYAMWPWFADAAQISDPFEPYFQLWRHGVEYRFDGPSSVTIHVPQRG